MTYQINGKQLCGRRERRRWRGTDRLRLSVTRNVGPSLRGEVSAYFLADRSLAAVAQFSTTAK